MRDRIVLPGLLVLLALTPPLAAAPPAGDLEFFENKVRPVLVEHCYSCHAGKKERGGLKVDSRAALLKGGDTGPAIVPGKPEQSLLIKAVRHHGDFKMPPKGKLPEAVVANLAKWIERGAHAPEVKTADPTKNIDWTAARKFWSFQPVRRPALPAVKNTAWPKGDLDRFILARLEVEGLAPVTEADRRTLIRRATFDLIGLPPTPEEVEAFVKDSRPDAWKRLIDRLLASPHYGERWARYWLDVARYAEDQAHTFAVKPNSNAWRYRDWVIAAFNNDLPYDRFVKYQIAADLIEEKTSTGASQRAALGFFGLGAQYYKNTDAARAIADELDDRVDTLARGFLGLTVACARCHDHKYDPIPTQDYYSLAGVFQSCRLADVQLNPADEIARYQRCQTALLDAERKHQSFLIAERKSLASARVDQLPDYLLAGWKVLAKRQVKPRYTAADQAREDHLDPAALARMVKLLSAKAKAKLLPSLDPWRELPAKSSKLAVPDRLVKAGVKLQLRVKARIQQGAGLLPLIVKGKPARDENQVLMQSLFGEQGVFAIREADVTAQLTPEKKTNLMALTAKVQQARREMPPAPATAHGLAETSPRDMKVYIRGNPAQQGPVAPRRFLRILSSHEPAPFTRGSGRLELAEAIASKDNPLTARVFVNRVWMHHFGKGIVGTPSNFGALGERPTHPELLDYLADRFVQAGWSIKALHREILLSATYRLSSSTLPINLHKDPDNRLVWRMNRRRLDIESWRDALLAASGQLDRSTGGPTLNLGAEQNRRRTVYAKISRHELNGLLRLFDFPDANITSEKRTETTVPQQQLFVLNSSFVIDRARALAEKLSRETNGDTEFVCRAYSVIFGRPPEAAELRLGAAYLSAPDSPADKGKNQLTRRDRYAQVLLGSNEFLYVD